jgi:hypothetical protein
MNKKKTWNLNFKLSKGVLIMLFFNFLFASNLFCSFTGSNHITGTFSYCDLHYISVPHNQSPVGPKRITLVSESIIEPEENEKGEIMSLDGHYSFPYYNHIYANVFSLLDKKGPIVHSLFFHNEDTVSLVILFHAWKSFLC